jgi:hypothetical protein
VTTSSGVISDGDGDYANFVSCQWTLAPIWSSSVKMIFTSFDTEAGWDFVRVYSCSTIDCTSKNELSGSPFSGSTPPGTIFSPTGIMLITFDSDSSVVKSGFAATFFRDGCQAGTVSGDSSLFQLNTFGTSSRLRDSSLQSADLEVPAGAVAPTYTTKCQWAGAECAVFTSDGDSSGGGQFFKLPTVNLGRLSADRGFSICAWFVYDAIGSWSRIFDMGQGESSNNVLLAQDGSSNLNLTWFSGSTLDQLYSPNSFSPGTWLHACAVNQGRRWELYENGALVASKVSAVDLVAVDLTSNYIGRSNWNGDRLLRGKVDEFRMYNRALAGSEVADLFDYRGKFLFPSLLHLARSHSCACNFLSHPYFMIISFAYTFYPLIPFALTQITVFITRAA